MSRKPIRVLLVDDSPLALVVLQRMLSTSPEIEVVGVATYGRQALELIPHLLPAVICIDYHMPDMNGLELTQQVMEMFPTPILVVSSAVEEADSDRIFSLLEAGAVDVFPKPKGGAEGAALAAARLVKRIQIVSGVRVFGRRPKKQVLPVVPLRPAAGTLRELSTRKIVVMGSSTGGPLALQTILSELCGDFPIPILGVQHISAGFLEGLVAWLGSHFGGKVKIARNEEEPLPGHVYFPEENTHLVIGPSGRLHSSRQPPVGGHRPSVTTTFRSVADYYGSSAIGVLLTGMGRDGGEGLHALAQAGALTICQNEATCVIYGMPKDAIERGAAREVLPLGDIALALIEAAGATPFGDTGRKTDRKH